MSAGDELYQLIRKFSLLNKSTVIPFRLLADFVQKYARRYSDQFKSLQIYLNNPEKILPEELARLAESEKIKLLWKENTIESVLYPQFYFDLVVKEYQNMNEDPKILFPTLQSLNIPSEMVRSIEVKTQFISELENEKNASELLLLNLPEGLASFVVPKGYLPLVLAKHCVQKIRAYLHHERNIDYVNSRLNSLFSPKGVSVREILNKILFENWQATEMLLHPEDFSFRFWAYLSSIIIQEYKEKYNKLPDELNYCQAACIIGLYNVYFKGLQQNEKDIQVALNQLDIQLRKVDKPTALSDIKHFKDPKGILLLSKYTPEQLTDYLESKTRFSGNTLIPEIMRLKGKDQKEYYIHKDMLLNYIFKSIDEASFKYRKLYIDQFIYAVKNNLVLETLRNDVLFAADLESHLKEDEFFLYALLRYETLFVLRETKANNTLVVREIDKIIDSKNKTLYTMDRILHLDRKELLQAAKSYLPFWLTNPFFQFLNSLGRSISHFFKNLSGRFLANKPKDRSSASSLTADAKKVLGKQQTEASFYESVKKLKHHFWLETENPEDVMEALAEKWNPLYDPIAKKHFIEDINRFIMDYIRSIRRSLLIRPPDASRIQNLARSLAENQVFEKIRKKDLLIRYIEIFMVKTILSKRFR